MADDGGYSVWGAEDDDEDFRTQHQGITSISLPKRAPQLFDDLEESTADWDVQASPPQEVEVKTSKRHSILDEALPSPAFAPTSGLQADEDAFFDSTPTIEDDLADRLNSAGFDDFGEAQYAAAGDKDDDFGDFGEFEEEQQAEFDVGIPELDVAGPSREWVSVSCCLCSARVLMDLSDSDRSRSKLPLMQLQSKAAYGRFWHLPLQMEECTLSTMEPPRSFLKIGSDK